MSHRVHSSFRVQSPLRVIARTAGVALAMLLVAACSASTNEITDPPPPTETAPPTPPAPTPTPPPTPTPAPTPTPEPTPPPTPEVSTPVTSPADTLISYVHNRGLGGWQNVLVLADGTALTIGQTRGTPPMGAIVQLDPELHRQIVTLTADPAFTDLPGEVDDGTEYMDRSSITISTHTTDADHQTRAVGQAPESVAAIHEALQQALADATVEVEGDQDTLRPVARGLVPIEKPAGPIVSDWIRANLVRR